MKIFEQRKPRKVQVISPLEVSTCNSGPHTFGKALGAFTRYYRKEASKCALIPCFDEKQEVLF